MRVLFIGSGNRVQKDPIIYNQGDSLTQIGVEVVYFHITGKGFIGYLRNLFPLMWFIYKVKPEIIHAHYSFCGFLARLATRRPVIVSLMGSDLIEISPQMKLVILIFVRYFWTTTIVKTVAMQKIIGPKKVRVQPNGVSFEKYRQIDLSYARQKLGWDSNSYYILFPSNPARPEKNFELAKAAFEIVKGSYSEIHLVTLNNIPREEVYIYYNAVDLLLLTSLHEGSPNVIKEAMACNCPIVATDVGDTRLLIAKTAGCFIVDFNPQEVAANIKRAIDFGKRTRGRENINYLNSISVAKQIKSIYMNSILESK